MLIAKLIANGGSQAVRLPKEMRFDGKEVFAKKVGNSVVLIPVDDPWGNLKMSLDLFTEDFMSERDQPAAQEREEL